MLYVSLAIRDLWIYTIGAILILRGTMLWTYKLTIQHWHVIDDLNQDDPTSEVETEAHEGDESKLPLQLAIVGRPNVGKSTLLNTLLQEQRVLVGPEAGLTRDSIRAQFQFDNRTVYLVS